MDLASQHRRKRVEMVSRIFMKRRQNVLNGILRNAKTVLVVNESPKPYQGADECAGSFNAMSSHAILDQVEDLFYALYR
jgi:hypothetical protein